MVSTPAEALPRAGFWATPQPPSAEAPFGTTQGQFDIYYAVVWGTRTAFKIGLVQCLAMIPGVSRSGSTIVGAMLMGVGKRAAAEFSFFLSMPTMAGAFAYDLMKNRDILDAQAMGNIVVGFVCAFIAALIVVKWLLNYVSKHGYALFAWWRIIVGTLALLALAAGM